MKKRLNPKYFESQKQAANALGLDVRELRDMKAENCCPEAFKYGRIYHEPLLECLKKRKAAQTPAESPTAEPDQLPRSHWDRELARVKFEREQFALQVEKKKHVELDEICAAVGQMLSGFRTACNMLPGSAARWLIGLKDFHAIKARLESEVDGVLHALGRCRYLKDVAPVAVERLFGGRTPEFRQDLVKCCERVFIEIGRECFKELQLPLDDEEAGGKNATRWANSV